jgi:hypothetical protein
MERELIFGNAAPAAEDGLDAAQFIVGGDEGATGGFWDRPGVEGPARAEPAT